MSRAQIVPPEQTERVERRDRAPEPPTMKHRLHLPRLQRIGLPLMLVAPALALAGLFDPRQVRHERRIGALVLELSVPERGRLHRTFELDVEVYNGGDRPLDPEIAISPEYFAGARSIEMVPSPDRPWAVRLHEIGPGERGRVEIDWLADRGGMQRGLLRVQDGAGHEASIELETFVFP